uniref:Uncharacterized protein n=1 Tax=Cacopsylla melanoneura TaxID=428564 RepID=A0A8D8LPR9_9HEMI
MCVGNDLMKADTARIVKSVSTSCTPSVKTSPWRIARRMPRTCRAKICPPSIMNITGEKETYHPTPSVPCVRKRVGVQSVWRATGVNGVATRVTRPARKTSRSSVTLATWNPSTFPHTPSVSPALRSPWRPL